MAEGARDLSEVSSVRALILFMKALPSGSDYLPMSPTPHIITFRIRISAYKFGRTQILSLKQCFLEILGFRLS